MDTHPVAFEPTGIVQEGVRVGDGEEATQLRDKLVFSMASVVLLRDTLNIGPGEKNPQINNCCVNTKKSSTCTFGNTKSLYDFVPSLPRKQCTYHVTEWIWEGVVIRGI